MPTPLGSLDATMLDPQRLQEEMLNAQMQQLQQAAQDRATQMQGSADQAAQALQQAQAAPTNTAPPWLALLPLLGQSIASTISGNPTYAQQGQQALEQNRQDILQKRAEHLNLLSDRYKEMAKNAAQAGNYAAEFKFNLEAEKHLKTLQQIHEKQQQARDLQAAQKRTETTVGAQAATSAADNAAALARTRLQVQGGLQEALIRAGIDPKTGKPLPQVPGAMTATERTSFMRAGIDPASGLRLPTSASKEITDSLKLLRSGSLKKEQKGEVATNVIRLTTERWSSDKTPAAMRSRLVQARHPLYAGNAKDTRYLLTEEKVYKKVGGKWIEDKDARERAMQAAIPYVQQWFQPQGQ